MTIVTLRPMAEPPCNGPNLYLLKKFGAFFFISCLSGHWIISLFRGIMKFNTLVKHSCAMLIETPNLSAISLNVLVLPNTKLLEGLIFLLKCSSFLGHILDCTLILHIALKMKIINIIK